MKIAIITLSLVLCISSCKQKHKNTEKSVTSATSLEIEKKEFKAIIDSSNVKGAILIYDLKQDTYFFATNLEPNKDFELNTFIKKRMNLTLMALKKLNVLK
ncbi:MULTISPECIES: DUF5031 domain-containing protein [unclassified Cellulophaga]|uniref:DUF5031 domain-containing protein n=1 Tax=unclassified Cellulophaga TaxID=2634405 RepID=UPI0026E25F34|nr:MULTISPECIES: DUF5031 domain-containing protein [unclassified Cellulophaga]MDO6490185.1 DUF5031 domain-containing protein [Cellulophaga sp. 2_MG-2023]MDO6494621.1 DUF5031 domain-containing protein [Cellulophaga sp. 3_MG-2023]